MTEKSTNPGMTPIVCRNFLILVMLAMLLLISGDIHPNPGPTHKDTKISIVHNNIRSLTNKAVFIETELGHFDIITLSETWLHDQVPNDKLVINGYSPPIRRDRQGNTGYGGVAIYLKNNLICIHRPDLEVPDL